MMYDHEKSDPAIVAVMPTNKAGQPAAELVEPRAGAEGNVSQQSTGRAQYRETVSQALKRIRNFVRISRRAVTHPRWEPYARIGLVRICAGGREVTRVPTANVICSERVFPVLTQLGLDHTKELPGPPSIKGTGSKVRTHSFPCS